MVMTHHCSTIGRPNWKFQALARRLHHIYKHSPTPQDTVISTYYTPHHPLGHNLCPQAITQALRQGVTDLKLNLAGLTLTQISTYSLRAGGAMATCAFVDHGLVYMIVKSVYHCIKCDGIVCEGHLYRLGLTHVDAVLFEHDIIIVAYDHF